MPGIVKTEVRRTRRITAEQAAAALDDVETRLAAIDDRIAAIRVRHDVLLAVVDPTLEQRAEFDGLRAEYRRLQDDEVAACAAGRAAIDDRTAVIRVRQAELVLKEAARRSARHDAFMELPPIEPTGRHSGLTN